MHINLVSSVSLEFNYFCNNKYIIFRQNQRWKMCYKVPEREELHLTNCGYSCNGESSVQFSSVAQLCLTLCDPMDCSTPGLPVHHQLLELAQTHVHRVSDAIQPSSVLPFSSCPQSFPASGTFPVSQLFASGQSIGVSRVYV